MFSQTRRARLSSYLKSFTSILTLASLLVVAAWLYSRRQELEALPWSTQWFVVLLLIGMYGVSLVLEFIVWHTFMLSIASIGWLKDLQLYAYSNLSRRLPSGLGYLFVRTVQYGAERVNSASVVVFSVLELVLLIVTGVLLSAITLSLSIDVSLVIFLSLLSVSVVIVLHPQRFFTRVLKAVGLYGVMGTQLRDIPTRKIVAYAVLYCIAWLNGGLMLYITTSTLTSEATVGILSAIGYWTVSASVGLLGSLVPIGQVSRDITLSILLQRHMPLYNAIAVALIFRVVITVGDVLWSLFLYALSRLAQRKY